MNVRLYIDYDNVGVVLKRGGLLGLATRCLLATNIPTLKTTGRCDIRVYGGWYEGSTLTALAQCIIAELGQDFPTVLPYRNQAGDSGKLLTTAELACSLEAEPSHHLFNTFRRKSPPADSHLCASYVKRVYENGLSTQLPPDLVRHAAMSEKWMHHPTA